MAKEYFSHDYNARNDRKIAALVMDYKSSGYGIFWAVCEMMHEEGDKLEFDDLTIGSISKDLNEDVTLIKEVLEKCISKYKLFHKNEALLQANEAESKQQIITSNRVKQNLSDRNDKKKVKIEAGRIGGIKSGESRRTKQNEALLEATKQSKVKESKVKESKESITPEKNNLKNSNLFRQPDIPIFDEVLRIFIQHGGNEKMAKTFFDKNESTGWFYRGSPITNYSNLVPSYIDTWKKNDSKNTNGIYKSEEQPKIKLS